MGRRRSETRLTIFFAFFGRVNGGSKYDSLKVVKRSADASSSAVVNMYRGKLLER